jgi:hypothetical protein
MSYKIIQPPFTLKFREMSTKELKDYFRWFAEKIPERLDELANAVRETRGFEAWEPDRTPDSLNALGAWFLNQVETRPRTEDELQKIKDASPFPIPLPATELTNKTFSLAIDIGMYVSQVFLANYPSLRWSQPFGNKKFVDYGQPVLISFGFGPFNPVHMMVTLAYGLTDKTWDERRLRGIYDIWANNVELTGKEKGTRLNGT